MKWFSSRMRAISTLIFEAGMSTRLCPARHALRMRVRQSATGSVMTMLYSYLAAIQPLKGRSKWPRSRRTQRLAIFSDRLPACLADAGDFALERQLPKTDPAQTELAQECARTAAPVATAVATHLELGLLLASRYPGFFGHVPP